MDPRLQHLQRQIQAALMMRFDANESAFLARETLFVRAQTADVLYAPLKSMQFIPVKTPAAPPGARSISYRQMDRAGMAKIVANYARDFPRVDVIAKEFPRKVHTLGDSYGWSIEDMQAAALAGLPLDGMKAAAARDFILRRHDQLAATGIAGDSSWQGFINNSNIPLVSVVTGSWATASPLEIYGDILALTNAIVETSMEVHTPDTLLLAPELYSLLLQPMSATQPGLTILKYILANNPYLKRVEQWTRLTNADAGGTGPRILAYAMNPLWIYQEMVIEFEQFPPQLEALDYTTYCRGRTGGTVIPYPLACAAMDGC